MGLILPQDDMNDALAFKKHFDALAESARELAAKAAKWNDYPLAQAWGDVADYLANVDHDTLTGGVIPLTNSRVGHDRIAA